MKIFSAAQIKQWDQDTILQEPIDALQLMERAAIACTDWLVQHGNSSIHYVIFCGSGNNGGDGLAIARLLLQAEKSVQVFALISDKPSAENEFNSDRLLQMGFEIQSLNTASDLPEIGLNCCIVDALFGTGLNKPLTGMAQLVVQFINHTPAIKVAIDLPSGLYADSTSPEKSIVQAHHTLSFQAPKLAFMMEENFCFTGMVHLIEIGLHPEYYSVTDTLNYQTDLQVISGIYKPRKRSGHKYNFGHALMFAGSNNMMGAAILCAKACLRSGAGLVTVHVPVGQSSILQTALPEAIATVEDDGEILLSKKTAIGVGPGLAINDANTAILKYLLEKWTGPIVADASALTMLKPLLPLLQLRKDHQLVLTPHHGEFERLFGKSANQFDRMKLALEQAHILNCYILLKGPHSLIACPDGKAFFNSTGNSGMATAGSGDVLTGIITGLLAQGYMAKEACIFGAYLHGIAGDLAADAHSKEAMIAGDIIEQLGKAFLFMQKKTLAFNGSVF